MIAIRSILAIPALLALSACAAMTSPELLPPPSRDGWAALGQETWVDGPHVTPLRLIEDSRCPAGAQCVWAGRVVVRVRVGRAGATTIGAGERDVTLGEPFAVADGHMTLVAALPSPARERPTAPETYRFHFTFAGGY